VAVRFERFAAVRTGQPPGPHDGHGARDERLGVGQFERDTHEIGAVCVVGTDRCDLFVGFVLFVLEVGVGHLARLDQHLLPIFVPRQRHRADAELLEDRFDQRQRQWAYFLTRPLQRLAYRALAKARCLLMGHEWSPCWEEEKFDLTRLGHTSTHCVFCGASHDQ